MVTRTTRRVQRPIRHTEQDQRLPPGQIEAKRWPVLHQGDAPAFDPATWDLTIDGEVDAPLRLDWAAFQHLPRVALDGDFHCVTRWSVLDNHWEGVSLVALLERSGIRPSTQFILFTCDGDYTANAPLEAVTGDGLALLATHRNGEVLAPERGFPVRVIIPHLYAWKSAKWVRRITLLRDDRPGFWEQYGYHHRGDVAAEERFEEASADGPTARGDR
jgi:DMSO/TMAO reductase YedYZ molybdopterin-dependent catalytic subunit